PQFASSQLAFRSRNTGQGVDRRYLLRGMVSPFGLRGIILSTLNREERQATPALRIEQSTVEIGIAPECVILDVRGTHNDHNEGRVFTNGALALNVRDIDVLLRELK